MAEATYKSIWDTLSKVNCSDHVESKNGLTYLSWAWAWGMLMKHFPNAEINMLDEEVMPDGSALCNVEIVIGDCKRRMWLPVLDFRNKPIQNPNSWNINSTRMRVLTKCIGLFGLGHYIYAGEDLPEADPTKQVKQRKPTLKPIPIHKKNDDPNHNEKMQDAYDEKLQSKKDRAISIVLKDSILAIDNLPELRDYWKHNSEAINKMDDKKSITEVFTDRAATLTAKTEEK